MTDNEKNDPKPPTKRRDSSKKRNSRPPRPVDYRPIRSKNSQSARTFRQTKSDPAVMFPPIHPSTGRTENVRQQSPPEPSVDPSPDVVGESADRLDVLSAQREEVQEKLAKVKAKKRAMNQHKKANEKAMRRINDDPLAAAASDLIGTSDEIIGKFSDPGMDVLDDVKKSAEAASVLAKMLSQESDNGTVPDSLKAHLEETLKSKDVIVQKTTAKLKALTSQLVKARAFGKKAAAEREHERSVRSHHLHAMEEALQESNEEYEIQLARTRQQYEEQLYKMEAEIKMLQKRPQVAPFSNGTTMGEPSPRIVEPHAIPEDRMEHHDNGDNNGQGPGKGKGVLGQDVSDPLLNKMHNQKDLAVANRALRLDLEHARRDTQGLARKLREATLALGASQRELAEHVATEASRMQHYSEHGVRDHSLYERQLQQLRDQLQASLDERERREQELHELRSLMQEGERAHESDRSDLRAKLDGVRLELRKLMREQARFQKVDKAAVEMTQLKDELVKVKTETDQVASAGISTADVTQQTKLVRNLQQALNASLATQESMQGDMRRLERGHLQEKATMKAKISILQAMAGMEGEEEAATTFDGAMAPGGSAQSKLISALETRLATCRQERDHAQAELDKVKEELGEYRGTSSDLKKMKQQAKFNELAWGQEKAHLMVENKELRGKVKDMEHQLGSVQGKKKEAGESESAETILDRLQIEGYDAERQAALNAAQLQRDELVAKAIATRDAALQKVRVQRQEALDEVMKALKAEQQAHKHLMLTHRDEVVPAALQMRKTALVGATDRGVAPSAVATAPNCVPHGAAAGADAPAAPSAGAHVSVSASASMSVSAPTDDDAAQAEAQAQAEEQAASAAAAGAGAAGAADEKSQAVDPSGYQPVSAQPLSPPSGSSFGDPAQTNRTDLTMLEELGTQRFATEQAHKEAKYARLAADAAKSEAKVLRVSLGVQSECTRLLQSQIEELCHDRDDAMARLKAWQEQRQAEQQSMLLTKAEEIQRKIEEVAKKKADMAASSEYHLRLQKMEKLCAQKDVEMLELENKHNAMKSLMKARLDKMHKERDEDQAKVRKSEEAWERKMAALRDMMTKAQHQQREHAMQAEARRQMERGAKVAVGMAETQVQKRGRVQAAKFEKLREEGLLIGGDDADVDDYGSDYGDSYPAASTGAASTFMDGVTNTGSSPRSMGGIGGRSPTARGRQIGEAKTVAGGFIPAATGMLAHGKLAEAIGGTHTTPSCHEAVRSNAVYNQLVAEVTGGHLQHNDWPDPGRMLARRGLILNHRDVVVSVFAQSDRPGDMSVRVMLYDLESDLELTLLLGEQEFTELAAQSDWWCTDNFFDRDRKRLIPAARDKASEFLLKCLKIVPKEEGTGELELVARPLKDVPDDNELWRGNRNISGVSCEVIVRKADAMRRVEQERLRRIDAAQGELFEEKQRVNKPLIVVLVNRLDNGGKLATLEDQPAQDGLFDAKQLHLWLSSADLASNMAREVALQPELIDDLAARPHPLLQLVVQRLEIVRNARSGVHTLRIHNRTIERKAHRAGQSLGGVYYLIKVSPGAAGRLHFDASRPSKPTEVPLMLTVTQKELDDLTGGRAAALLNIESATECLSPYLHVVVNEAGHNVMLLRSKEDVMLQTKAKRFQDKQVEVANKVGKEFQQMLWVSQLKEKEKAQREVAEEMQAEEEVKLRQWARPDVAKPSTDYHLS